MPQLLFNRLAPMSTSSNPVHEARLLRLVRKRRPRLSRQVAWLQYITIALDAGGVHAVAHGGGAGA